MALHDIGLAIGRNDGLVSVAGRVAAHRSVVVVARTDNFAAVLDSSSAPAADNFPAAVIDSCAAGQSNCVPAWTGIGAGLQAGWILVVGVALDAAVANGWVPDGKNAVQDRCDDRCDDSARGTAPPPKPAS